ncbi:hypothetical protein N8I77_005246 [Diaporthe amygdali]|uniref:Uncharacterized protein n=1 Tax=Phomopsis amygdali TaxID=1214568 RepID=A0AAD9W2K4_PHOAM|nr:hypothetical protein N8I77_005246 [Diaporthe amygdali]
MIAMTNTGSDFVSLNAYHVIQWLLFALCLLAFAGRTLETVFVQCSTFSVIRETYVRVVMTAVLDIVSDITIFGMVGFTIAVTIVCGSIFGGVYKSINESGENQVNITWITFWFLVEFIVAYIIACIVSFRTLFVHNEQQSEARDAGCKRQESEERRRQGLTERMRRLYDSVLDTCRTWEGHWDDSSLSLLRTFRLPKPPSGRLSVDFSRDTGVSSSQRVSKEFSNEFQA